MKGLSKFCRIVGSPEYLIYICCDSNARWNLLSWSTVPGKVYVNRYLSLWILKLNSGPGHPKKVPFISFSYLTYSDRSGRKGRPRPSVLQTHNPPKKLQTSRKPPISSRRHIRKNAKIRENIQFHRLGVFCGQKFEIPGCLRQNRWTRCNDESLRVHDFPAGCWDKKNSQPIATAIL